jgi:transposase InsO family protein
MHCSTAHQEDPEFGYRYLVEEALGTGEAMAERTAWRICTENKWWSVFGKKRGKNGKTGPPVHDDLVERDFTAHEPNHLWLSDIPSIALERASSTSVRSRTCSPTASWATRSIPG